MSAVRHWFVPCEGDVIALSLHPAEGDTGVLIVPGGVQTRFGAHRGFRAIAALLAAAGYPVLRFDRRGVGDSAGQDPGFRDSAPDIAAALAAFRAAQPHLRAIIGIGLCDGAAALLLAHDLALDGYILLNPWTAEAEDSARAAADHLRRRATSRQALGRVLRGEFTLGQLAARARAILLSPAQTVAPVTRVLLARLQAEAGRTAVVLSDKDWTARAFESVLPKLPDLTLMRIPNADHSFGQEGNEDALMGCILSWLQTRNLPGRPGSGS